MSARGSIVQFLMRSAVQIVGATFKIQRKPYAGALLLNVTVARYPGAQEFLDH